MRGIFMALAFGMLANCSALAATPVEWSIHRVNTIIRSGTTSEMHFTFRASRNLGNVSIRVVPELVAHMQVSPPALSNVKAGDVVDLTLRITAGTPATSKIVDGTIQVRSAGGAPRLFARPLPAQLMIQVEDTLAGTDADSNGIWDDVDSYLAANFGDRPEILPALHQYVEAVQASLIDARDSELSLKHAREYDRASECVDSFYSDNTEEMMATQFRELAALRAAILNNRVRTLANIVFSEHLAGHVFPGVPPGQERSSCKF